MNNKNEKKSPDKRLSKKIMEYCNKYARNRDLDKYMRPCSGSSSDKSLQNFMTLTSFTQEEKENMCLDENPNPRVLKTHNEKEQDGGGFNLLLERRIEISADKNGESQNQFLSIDIHTEVQMVTPEKSDKLELSPASSSKLKLEWDSLADIGYNSKGTDSNEGKKSSGKETARTIKYKNKSTQHIDKTLASFREFTTDVHSTPAERKSDTIDQMDYVKEPPSDAERVSDEDDPGAVQTDTEKDIADESSGLLIKSLDLTNLEESRKNYVDKILPKDPKSRFRKSFSLEEIMAPIKWPNIEPRSHSEDFSIENESKEPSKITGAIPKIIKQLSSSANVSIASLKTQIANSMDDISQTIEKGKMKRKNSVNTSSEHSNLSEKNKRLIDESLTSISQVPNSTKDSNSKSNDHLEKSMQTSTIGTQSKEIQTSACTSGERSDLVQSTGGESCIGSSSTSFDFIPGSAPDKSTSRRVKKSLFVNASAGNKVTEDKIDYKAKKVPISSNVTPKSPKAFDPHLSASIESFLKQNHNHFARIKEGTNLLNAINNNKSIDKATKRRIFKQILYHMSNESSLEDSKSDIGVQSLTSSSNSSKSTSFKLDSLNSEKNGHNSKSAKKFGTLEHSGAQKLDRNSKSVSKTDTNDHASLQKIGQKPKKSSKSPQKHSPDWLEPMTISERNYEYQIQQKQRLTNRSESAPSEVNSSLKTAVRREKSANLKWIFETIEQLNRLKDHFMEPNEEPIQTSIDSTVQDDNISWTSHHNFQKPRTKLQTPVNDVQKIPSSNTSKPESLVSYAKRREKHFYEKYYSEARNAQSRLPNSSITSSNSTGQFLSSKSMTVSIVSSSIESKKDAVTQTSNSLETVTGISKFGPSRQVTKRVRTIQKNVQTQANPPPVAYLLTFPKESRIKHTDGVSSQPKVQAIHELEIQNCVTKTFLKSAEKRRQVLNEINEMRKNRCTKRQELMEIKSNESLISNLEKLPPPPLAHKRLFSSKTVRAKSRRRAMSLPENLDKKKIEKLNHAKKSQRMLTDVFNRNLQKQVLQGKLNFSNSVQNMM